MAAGSARGARPRALARGSGCQFAVLPPSSERFTICLADGRLDVVARLRYSSQYRLNSPMRHGWPLGPCAMVWRLWLVRDAQVREGYGWAYSHRSHWVGRFLPVEYSNYTTLVLLDCRKPHQWTPQATSLILLDCRSIHTRSIHTPEDVRRKHRRSKTHELSAAHRQTTPCRAPPKPPARAWRGADARELLHLPRCLDEWTGSAPRCARAAEHVDPHRRLHAQAR